MLSEKQIRVMVEMQNKMNKVIHEDWHTMDWDYMRAIALETAEAVEHHGWKWWKAQKKNLPQLQMEMIDIWHFYLSRYLQVVGGNEEAAITQILLDLCGDWTYLNFDEKMFEISKLDPLRKLDLLCGLACAKRMNIGLFFSSCKDFGLTMEDIYVQYVQKNTLNIFRQKNGYKEGLYHKEWFGEEDNEFLVRIAKKIDNNDPDYAIKLWDALEKTYSEAVVARG